MAWGSSLIERITCPAPVEPSHELVTEVDGLLVRARVLGAGPPVVLVHGLGASARCWAHNLGALARCSKVYVVDLPGFGESETPEDVPTPQRLAEMLARWCLAVGLQRASFIGHSLGGEICMWLAATYPTMVTRLVLAASTGAKVNAGFWRRLGRLMLDGFREPANFMPTILDAYMKAGPHRIVRTMLGSAPDLLEPRLGEIHAETLVIWGARDPVITIDEARSLVRAIPRGRLAVIEDGAHGIIFDAPQRFNRITCGFLTEAC